MSVNTAYPMPVEPGWYLSGLGIPMRQCSPVGVTPQWVSPSGLLRGKYLSEDEARAMGPFRRMRVIENENGEGKTK